MKRLQVLFVFTLAILFTTPIVGQNTGGKALKSTKTASLKQDTLPTPLYQSYFGKLDSLFNDPFFMKDVHLDPHYFRLFTPMTYYRSPMDQASENLWKFKGHEAKPDFTAKLLPFNDSEYKTAENINKQVNKVLINLYVNHPELVKKHENQIMSKKILKEEAIPEGHKKPIIQLFRPDDDLGTITTEADIIIHKPNFWTKGGSGSLQFTQNYISSNWYKGGESSNNLLGNLLLYSNYNDKEKIQLENSLEIKTGLNTVSSDTLNKYKVNTDLFRIYSKLGIQAASNWYYTLSTEFNTQLLKNYKKNSKDLASSFLSPANLIVSVGMDYKYQKRKVNLSVFISPAAYNLRYVRSKDVDETAFGLKEGKKTLNDLGSKLQSNITWEIFPAITWTSRLYYFTNYEKVEAEWENTFNFVLNRYLSTKLFVHARFDDGAKRMKGKNYLQLQELLSFGINYKW